MRLIDADALIDFIGIGHLRNLLEACFSERDVVDMLESRPTIDAAPVLHREWIYYNNNGWRVCSHCKDRRRTFTLDNYCPNCGAKMDGGTICE